jgi:hypothetical protein
MSARLIRAAAGTLLLALAACSGGRDPTGPDQNPPGGDPPGGEQQNPPPAGDVSGVYVLANVNDGNPGQTVMLSNPDGRVIGIYRFDSRQSKLTLNPDRTWTLSLAYEDDQHTAVLEDEGTFAADQGQEDGFDFHSNRYGDDFHVLAKQGVAVIGYDFDGDGQIDTHFAFGRLGTQG